MGRNSNARKSFKRVTSIHSRSGLNQACEETPLNKDVALHAMRCQLYSMGLIELNPINNPVSIFQ